MIVGPLVGLVVTQLVSGGGRTLLPSPEVAYAAVLGRRRLELVRRPWG